DTDIVTITVKMDKPDKQENQAAKMAVAIANELANTYKDYTLEKSKGPKEEGLEELQRELDDLNRRIAATSQHIADLREQYDLTSSHEGESGIQGLRSDIAALDSRLVMADLEMGTQKRKYEQSAGMSNRELAVYLRHLTGDTYMEQLLELRQQQEINLGAMEGASLGDRHPDMVRARALLSKVEDTIEERTGTARKFILLNYQTAQADVDKINEKREELKEKERALSSGGAQDLRDATAELATMKSRRDFLERSIDDEKIKLRLVSSIVEVIQPAKVVGTALPVSPNFAMNILLSIFAGLFFGIVLAFFVEYLDTSIKTVDDIEKYIGLPVLGMIPQKVRHLNDPTSRAAHSEPYRVLRTNIRSSKRLPGDGKLFCVTSASAGEGKTQTLFNLAYVFAGMGSRVIIVDADMHRPRQHKIVHIENAPGLCNVIVGETKLDDCIRPIEKIPNLDMLPSGKLTGSSVHGLADTDEMRHILETLKQRYDVILMDAPPMVGVSDTAHLVRLVDGVVLVAQHRKYPRALIKRAKDMIINMGGNLLGVALNNINVARDYSSYYYKQQYYYYGPYAYARDKGKS
ncbi:MAG: polysaccharide biosynthesis tyrosine autokinase, partial [Kiritimatiellaeota bacterium]|nr:polysaccharide biosynthesis tyrosine autokinase [Kiritimatiellota bacterium]